jgi:hypothetical protein
MPVSASVRILFPLVVVALSAAPAAAQDWGAKMFDRTEIKFGSAARFADTTFKVKVKNPFVEEIQITSLTTSCGCISWQDKPTITLKSKEEKELTIRLDTVGHSGDKRVRAYVSLYEPTRRLSSQVTIPVEGRIRTDFEVRPSNVGFGAIDFGTGYIQKITVTYNGGRPDWKIVQAKVSNPLLTAKFVEKSRAGGSATYEATVEISRTAPLGVLRDQLILTTNEVGDANISIPVEARVEADIMVTDVQFGSLTPGQSKTMTVVARGKKPFKISKVDHIVQEVVAKPAEDGSVSTKDTVSLTTGITVKAPETTAIVHMLSVTVTPPAESGMFDEEFSVVIEGRREPVKFKAKGRIQAQEVTGNAK